MATVLSHTLQSLTSSKIRELEKKQTVYEQRKAQTYAQTDQQSTLLQRVAVLLDGANTLLPDASKDGDTLSNIGRWLDQHRYDPAVTEDMLQDFEIQLRASLDAYSRKLSLADLYSRLLTEWTTSPEQTEDFADGGVPEEDYMLVDDRQKQRLKQLCEQFEEVVFTPLETSSEEINIFLDRLFPGDEGKDRLRKLREDIGKKSKDILDDKAPFSRETLSLTIRGLLTEDILSDEKQTVLKGFLQNKVALTEISDVLNLWWVDLDNWDWQAEDGIPVLPRQQLNGKYRIWMDEDVLQLIFVQYIGVRLCNMLKSALQNFIDRKGAWNWAVGPQPTDLDNERRSYYIRQTSPTIGLEKQRKVYYTDTYFLSQLPGEMTSLAEGGGSYDQDSDDDDDDDDDEDKEKTPANVKQELLRTIATETLLHRNIHGKAAVVQSDLRWYATGLPHSTIFAVMRFAGFHERWISFFQRYLESPLNMDQSSEGRQPTGPRTRKRGVPMAHASEKLTGELILFFMDLAVNRETGLLLYRLHDDLWVCGEPSKCARAWQVMNEYAQVTGLEFNTGKTGSAYLADTIDPTVAAQLPQGAVTFGFLMLDAPSGEWVIDRQQVDAHVHQLKKQLDECNSVISWIRTWNSCIGRFFKNTFGQPAFCFGKPHVDSILTTYKIMQEILFGESTVTQHLRRMIQSKFGMSDFPDAFFYYPENLGGLGLRNPFISPFLVRDSMESSPLRHIEKFKEAELAEYQALKKAFDGMSEKARLQRYQNSSSLPVSVMELHTFMSLEEWSQFRWSLSGPFHRLYQTLLDTPDAKNIRLTNEVKHALGKIKTPLEIENQEPEIKWILQMYGLEVAQKYGRSGLVDKRYLPVGVMAMVKEKKVKWQMVL